MENVPLNDTHSDKLVNVVFYEEIDAKGKKTKSRGTWRYKYDSTAAWGGTIFWAYNADFLKASGNKVYQ